jgi:hypothetical protein
MSCQLVAVDCLTSPPNLSARKNPRVLQMARPIDNRRPLRMTSGTYQVGQVEQFRQEYLTEADWATALDAADVPPTCGNR